MTENRDATAQSLHNTRVLEEEWKTKQTALLDKIRKFEDDKAEFKKRNDDRIVRTKRLILRDTESKKTQTAIDAKEVEFDQRVADKDLELQERNNELNKRAATLAADALAKDQKYEDKVQGLEKFEADLVKRGATKNQLEKGQRQLFEGQKQREVDKAAFQVEQNNAMTKIEQERHQAKEDIKELEAASKHRMEKSNTKLAARETAVRAWEKRVQWMADTAAAQPPVAQPVEQPQESAQVKIEREIREQRLVEILEESARESAAWLQVSL